MDSNQITKMNPKIVVITEENKKVRCTFCRKSRINDVEWGPMCKLDDIVVHYFCMLFSSALRQNGKDTEGILGFLPSDLWREIKRGEKLKCKHCKRNRATVGCAVKQCKASFHFSCGIPNGALNQFSGSFSSYCSTHKPAVKIPIPQESWNCEICFFHVESDEFPVWPPCCKRRVFHRSCIQSYATNSGYFFSCPCCKDKEVFIRAMKDSGVYVPEQDASWELAPNAFAELNQMYSHCDAEECLCPQGRSYDCPNNRSWKIVRCGSCGSSAIHYSCGQLSLASWKCPECINVLTRDPSHYRMVVLEGANTSGESDADEVSEEEDGDSCSESFHTIDENCRIEIAARSSLSGLEREADRVSNPVDYISSATVGKVISCDEVNETQEAVTARPKRANLSKRIVYNRNFRKRYKMDLATAIQDSDSAGYDTGEDDDDAYATRRTRLTRNLPDPSIVDTHKPGNSTAMTELKETSSSRESDKSSPNKTWQVEVDNLNSKFDEFSDNDMDDLFATTEKLCRRTTRSSNKLLKTPKKTGAQAYSKSKVTETSVNFFTSVSEKSDHSKPNLSSTGVSENMDKSTVECTVVSANNNDVSKQNGISKSESECIGGSTDNFNASEKNCNSKSVSECAGTSSNNSEVSQNSLKSNLNFKTSDSEEIQVIKETISPQKKRFEVINLEDVLEDDDDDCVEIKMENVPSKNPISSFKQQGSWPPGCKSPIVKSSALMQVLKTDNNKEVCIIDDEDDYQQVTIHFSSSRSKKSKGLDQENHEIILIDDDDQDCIDSGKARREDNYSDNTKSRFGTFISASKHYYCSDIRIPHDIWYNRRLPK